MLGTRGIWHDGWKAVTTHPAISGWSHFEQDTGSSTTPRWTAVRGARPRRREPDKLAELIGLWYYEAGVNHAFPLDDRLADRDHPDSHGRN